MIVGELSKEAREVLLGFRFKMTPMCHAASADSVYHVTDMDDETWCFGARTMGDIMKAIKSRQTSVPYSR